MRRSPRFAVVISDMRMPEMSGAAFLKQVATEFPDVTRVLMTGHTDLNDAIETVNAGRIFRFLLKPCPMGQLMTAIAAAVAQHRLIHAERELLTKTVQGAINLLTEVLALSAPVVFRTATATRRVVTHLCDKLTLGERWKYETAALLARLGWIAIPGETLERQAARMPVSTAERTMLDNHAETGQRLLTGIPRLEEIAAMIGRQRAAAPADEPGDEIERGAAFLRVALIAADLLGEGRKLADVVAVLRERCRGWDRVLVEHLIDLPLPGDVAIRLVAAAALKPGMVLDADARTKTGVVLCTRGAELTLPLIERIRRFAEGVGVVEPFHVHE